MLQHILHILGRCFQSGLFIPVLVTAMGFITSGWKTWRRRIGTGAARNWPTITASVDVASVVERVAEGRSEGRIKDFVGTLTYFYRNPELQMGEYERVFPLRAAAQQWAQQFKGRQVLVHINPRDPADSVLLKADLEGVGLSAAPSLEDSLRLEKVPRLATGYLLLSGISELIAMAGLAMCVVGLWMRILSPSGGMPRWEMVLCAGMAVFSVASAWFLTYRLHDKSVYQDFLASYRVWCPAWMRWAVNGASVMVSILWLLVLIAPDWPAAAKVATELRPYMGYVLGSWIFLVDGAMHAALLRSQETLRPGSGIEQELGAGLDPGLDSSKV